MTDQLAASPLDPHRLVKRWTVVLLVSALFTLWASCRVTRVLRQLPRQGGESIAGAPQAGVVDDPGSSLASAERAAATPWYRCTMPECGDGGSADPQSRCPVCGMKREQTVAPLGASSSTYELKLTERARSLANVAAEPALRRTLFKRIRSVGKVSYDETRRQIVSAYTAGRVDRLYADFTGMVVEEGDKLAEIYSPDLISLQDEYLRRIRARQSTDKVWRSWALSSRRKLELLGFSLEQVRSIEKADEPATHLILHAPISGTIVRKNCITGAYVADGELLFEIADLTRVWLVLDYYEMDLPWIHPFQTVRVTAESLPGEAFSGRIIFIDPVVDTRTRTVKVRVQVDNPERKLKPQMFVSAEIVAALDEQGRAVPPKPASAHACPTHPWERMESAGSCPICNSELIWMPTPAHSAEAQPVLSVPKEAVLQTGERAVIYRQADPGRYEALAVRIGPLAQDDAGRQFYPILGGLSENELIVTRGNFLIDSQLQIAQNSSVFGAGVEPPTSQPSTAAHAPDQHLQAAPEQTICPVMGGKIDPEVFTLYTGVKVFFCCPGCEGPFHAEPEKYIPKLPPVVQARIRQAENGTAD